MKRLKSRKNAYCVHRGTSIGMSLVGGLLGSTMWAGLMKAISPKDRSGWDTFGDSVLGSLVGTAMGTAFARVAATNAIVQCLNDHDDE